MNQIINFLSERINIKQAKYRSYAWISKECPFSDYVSKKSNIFRYNQKLKVGKCYHCGKGFKELYWLKLQLDNSIKAQHILILHEQLCHPKYGKYLIKKLYSDINDKNNTAYGNFVKFDEYLSSLEKDDDLPF